MDAGLLETSKYHDHRGVWSYDIERQIRWMETSDEMKLRMLKYLRLVVFISIDINLVGRAEKDWVLQNATIDTTIIPNYYWDEFQTEGLKYQKGVN